MSVVLWPVWPETPDPALFDTQAALRGLYPWALGLLVKEITLEAILSALGAWKADGAETRAWKSGAPLTCRTWRAAPRRIEEENNILKKESIKRDKSIKKSL